MANDRNKNKKPSRVFLSAAFFLLLAFYASPANAAYSNYGWLLTNMSVDNSCGATVNKFSSAPVQYTNSSAITVGNNNTQIRRISDLAVINNWNTASASGVACFDWCTQYINIDITGNATYPSFAGKYSFTCGGRTGRAVMYIHLPTVAQGIDYQMVFPMNQWINYDPQIRVQLVNYPASFVNGTTNHTMLANTIQLGVEDNIGAAVNKYGYYNFSSGKAIYTLPALGLADGQHTYTAFFRVGTNTGYYITGGRMPYQWFGIDRVKPVVNSFSVSPANPNATQAVTISTASTDVSSGLGNMKIYLDGVLKTTCNFAGETTQRSCSIGVGTLTAGTHAYYFTATDRAGNILTSSTSNFAVTAAAALKVTKTAVGGNGTFNFTGSGGIAPFSITTVAGTGSYTISNLAPGTYSVTEGALGAGWSKTGDSCIGGVAVTAGNTGNCTVTNTASGSLKVTKTAVGGNGTFNFTGSGGIAPFSITTAAGTGSYTINNLTPGTYSVTEGALGGGWSKTGDACIGGVAVTAGNTANCTVANNLAQPPVAVPNAAVQPDYCTAGPSAIFSWNYSDPQGRAQSAYRLQVIDETKADFTSPNIDTGKISSATASWATGAGQLGYNHTYRWRLIVWNTADIASVWTNGANFSTPAHQYPQPDFTSAPRRPLVGEKVDFTDTSVSHSAGGAIQSWAWTFANGTPNTSTEKNPSSTFSVRNNSAVGLTVTDSDGHSCQTSKNLFITRPLPTWTEVAPVP